MSKIIFRTMQLLGKIILTLFVGLAIVPRMVMAVEAAPKISDREIIESLTTIKGEIRRLDQRFEAIDQRFEAIDQRFEAMDRRFESVDRRFDELRGFMLWGFGVMFAGIFSLIGFVLWDRRTALAPAIAKNRELEEREERLEKVFKVLAQNDPKIADAMRHVGLR